MKEIFTLLTLVSLGFTGFAQKTDAGIDQDLMKQSRKARTTSIILVSTGPVVAIGGLGTLLYGVIEQDLGNGRNPVYDQNGNFIGYDTQNYTTEIVVGAVATAVGIGIALSSIHFSKKANDLKRQARGTKLKTSIDRINIPGMQNSFANTARQYKVSLVIPLGK